MAKQKKRGIQVRLVIQEYLSMLKESGELDVLLPDLLLSMGIEPISKAQVGVRQFGVDVAAVGVDPKDNVEKLFLFTIKPGDIGRNEWEGNPQSVRPSLAEIIDTYIPTHIEQKHKNLCKKVVLCCGGDLKQPAQLTWAQYTKKHSKPDNIELELWNGEKLAIYIEKYFLDEYLFPITARKKIRKTLALLDLNEYELSHFYSLVEETLFDRKLPKSKSSSAQKKRFKAIRLVHLSLHIVFKWAEEGGNLKPALLGAEYVLLRVWDWMRQYKLLTNKKTLAEFFKIYNTYNRIGAEYFHKIQPNCYVRDGLFGYGGDELEYPIRTFEVIGILGILGFDQFSDSLVTRDKISFGSSVAIVETLIPLIRNNPAAKLPCYDGHAIDICLALLLLYCTNHKKEATEWIEELVGKISFAYRIGRHFPIASDSYEDLIDMEVGVSESKEKLMNCSTLFPILAQWCAIFDIPDIYKILRQNIEKFFTETTLQLWYPDEETENLLYKSNASRSGATIAPIHLPENLEDVRDHMRRIQDNVLAPSEISCIAKGFPVIGLIASRHFRTPVIPFFWQSLV